MCFRLAHYPARPGRAATCIAQHVDPGKLKCVGYDIARSLGDPDALWRLALAPDTLLEMRCRNGDALAIEPVGS